MHSRIKKAALCIAMMLMLFTAFHTTAFAADKTYEIEELGVKISLPADMSVATRTTKENDPAYKALGYSYADAQKEMKDSDIYLKGISKDAAFEIDTYMVSNEHSRDIYNFKLLNDKQLNAVKDELKADKNCTNCTVTQSGDAIYFNLETQYEIPAQGNAKAVKIYSILGYTVVNGQQISFSLRSVGDPVSVAEHGLFNDAMKSIKYNEILPKPLQVDMIGIIVTAVIVVAVFVVIIAVIIILRGLRKRKTHMPVQGGKYAHKKERSPLGEFYDELEKDGLLDEQVSKTDESRGKPEEELFTTQPIRLTVEVPVKKDEDDGVRAVDETKKNKRDDIAKSGGSAENRREDEKDSVELTRSNNEDYDEPETDDNSLQNSKLRIFVGGAGSKIKNSVSSVSDLLKSRREEQQTEKQKPIDDYDALSDDSYEENDSFSGKEPLPDNFEEEIIQAETASKEPQVPEAVKTGETGDTELEETLEEKISEDAVKEETAAEETAEKKPKRVINSNARESFSQVSRTDEVLSTFENDSYWDRYR